MRHKLVNRRTGNEIEQIKSFRYVEEVNVTENIRFGACVAAMIEVQFYKIREPNTYETFDNPVQNGDIIDYYQVDDENNETKIGVFTAKVDTPQRSIVSFVAYDNISKLDVDFSARLKSLADYGHFPMSVTALVNRAASVAGVTQHITDTSYLPSDLYDSSFLSANIKAFYADTITVRDVFSQLAEILSCYVRCDENGNIIPDTYNFDYVDGTSTQYLISPTDRVSAYVASQYTPIYYKENGLNYANYQADRPSETNVYDSNGVSVSWCDTVDRLWPDGKTYIVSSNIFIDNAETPNDFRFTAHNIMERLEKFKYSDSVVVDRREEVDPETGEVIIIETMANVHRTYKPTVVQLFPFNNPFRAGDVYWFSYNPYDLNPTRFRGVVTKLEITDQVATLTGTGQQVYESAKQNFEDQNQRTVSIESRLNSAENDIAGKVSKTGDIINGGALYIRNSAGANDHQGRLVLNNPDITLGETHTKTVMGEVMFNDSDNSRYKTTIFGNLTQANTVQLVMTARNWDSGGNALINRLTLSSLANGTVRVEVSHPNAWLDAISAATPTLVTTVSNIATAASGITINSAYFAQWGKVAQLRLRFTPSSALSGNTSVATLVSGKRPAANMWSPAQIRLQSGTTAYISDSGAIIVTGNFTAGNWYEVISTYILA